MSRFFLPGDRIGEDTVTLTGGDAAHISKSLRMRPGERITVCDMKQNEFECVICKADPDCVTAKIESRRRNDAEPPYRAVVYQALPKGDKLDTVIQKSVEIGAVRIVPFECERCVVREAKEKSARLAERRRKIAEEAAKQCGRGIIPEVLETVSFEEALMDARKGDVAFMCYEGDGTLPLGKFVSGTGRDYRFLIGPEGGFSKKEAEAAAEAGLGLCGLGKRILRTETAALFVLSCMAYVHELAEKN